MNSIALPRVRAWSKFGGNMMHNSAGVPAASRCREEALRAGAAGLTGVVEAADFAVGVVSGWLAFNQ